MIEKSSLINQDLDFKTIPSVDIISLDNKLQQTVSTVNSSDADFSYAEPFVQSFIIAITNLPPKDDINDYANDISKIMRNFPDPETGDPAFVTLEQQMALLQQTLAIVDKSSSIYEPLMSVFVGTMYLQSEMVSWMQDIILSGGKANNQQEW